MTDRFSYRGRHVVVTGGATGVGAALLEVLADLDCRDVSVLDIKAPAGPHARFIETDLSDEAAVEAAAAELDRPVDALFNNAGVNATAGLERTIAVNYLAPRRLAERLVPRMPEGAAIVNTASSAGNNWAAHTGEITELLAIDDWPASIAWVDGHRSLFEGGHSDVYFFSKEVVQLWTLRYASTLRDSHVRLNSVCPAPIDTPLLADFRK